MGYFYEEILQGFTELPVAGAPGIMVIAGKNAQAVFTSDNPADVFLAAAEYGIGRMFVATHGCYYTWLRDKTGGLEGQFVESVKKWLTRGAGADDSNTIDLSKVNENTDLSNYRLCFWPQDKELSDVIAEKARVFVENGGGLFAGMTPWGALQCRRNSRLEDFSMYRFFKNIVGIIFTDRYCCMPNRVPVGKNQAKYSNFNEAIQDVCQDAKQIPKYCRTIDCCVDSLSRCGMVDARKMARMKESLIRQCEENKWNALPCDKNPVKTNEEKDVAKLLCRCYIELGEKAPNISEFPGDFTELPWLETNVPIKLKTRFSERISTGYYLPAGVLMTVRVNSGNFKDWKIRIGAHSDVLNNCDRYCRWPTCYVLKDLKPELVFSSPFGGLVYFDSSKEGELDVTISNVVETPYFDVTKPEFSNDWISMRQKPGLWAELAGQYIIFTVPSTSIRDLDDARAVTQFWDEVVLQHHRCRGSDPNEQRRERVVCDRQASAGYMHSGYPVVTHLDVCQKECKYNLLNVENMRKFGSWGIFHELGHNMQRGEWTFDGCGEVTVNIFSMHAMERLVGLPIVEQEFVRDRKGAFPPYFSKKPNYDDWKRDCCLALMTFAQLIRNFGWEPMYQFMRNYELDMKNNRNALPKNNQEKIDQWVIRYSKIIQRNIKPQFEMWGLPVTDAVDAHVNSFPPFFPIHETNPDMFFRQNESLGVLLINTAFAK